MEKKALTAFISVLLLLAVAGIQLINLGVANPYMYGGVVSPDSSAKPPRISIFAPHNNTAYTINTIRFSINVSLPESRKAVITAIGFIYYEADWQENLTVLYASGQASFDDQIESSRTLLKNLYFQYSQDLTGIPDGNHTIRVYATGGGSYIRGSYRYGFHMNASSSVYFTIDTVPPKVFLSVENKTYYTNNIPLNFTVNEPNSQVAYSLDGQENMTIAGNTTLTNLAYGEHNVTVYATDNVENIGASETITFTIAEPQPEPFPTTMVIAPIASVAFVGVGLLVFFKKRHAKFGG